MLTVRSTYGSTLIEFYAEISSHFISLHKGHSQGPRAPHCSLLAVTPAGSSPCSTIYPPWILLSGLVAESKVKNSERIKNTWKWGQRLSDTWDPWSSCQWLKPNPSVRSVAFCHLGGPPNTNREQLAMCKPVRAALLDETYRQGSFQCLSYINWGHVKKARKSIIYHVLSIAV